MFRTMNTEQNMNTRNVSSPTYAQIAGLPQHSESSPPYDSNLKQTANEDITLSHFLTKFETMFSQLMQQNSVMLNLLTTLVNKLSN